MDTTSNTTPPAEASKRSPSFPIIAIDEAIDKAKLVYKADKRAFATYAALLEHLGYKARDKKGGRSARMVSTLKQYNLLEERDDQYRISDTAFRILETPDAAPERIALVRETAMHPPIIRKVLAHFQGQLPSDTTLRGHLIFTEKFNPDSATDFIRVLRRTITVANPSEGDYNVSDAGGAGAQSKPAGAAPVHQQPAGGSPNPQQFEKPPGDEYYFKPLPGAAMEFTFYLSQTKRGTLSIPLEITPKEWKLLRKQIDSSLDVAEATALVEDSPEPTKEPSTEAEPEP